MGWALKATAGTSCPPYCDTATIDALRLKLNQQNVRGLYANECTLSPAHNLDVVIHVRSRWPPAMARRSEKDLVVFKLVSWCSCCEDASVCGTLVS